MSTLVVPLAVGVVGIGLILLIVVALALAGLVYELITRGNPRQVEVDEERQQIAEQIGLSEPIDFQSDMRPPVSRSPARSSMAIVGPEFGPRRGEHAAEARQRPKDPRRDAADLHPVAPRRGARGRVRAGSNDAKYRMVAARAMAT